MFILCLIEKTVKLTLLFLIKNMNYKKYWWVGFHN